MRALIYTKKGDKYEEETLRRDFMALWNTGKFDDIRLEREPGQFGWIIRFVVAERPVVRTIKYEGNKSISVSEILDRFKERKGRPERRAAIRSKQSAARPRGAPGIRG